MQKKKTKLKKNNRIYFGSKVQEAIIRYNQTTDPREKSRIYEEHINYAFNKLVENIIRRYKFNHTDCDSYEDFKHEVVLFLNQKIPNYSEENGRAYSFFTVVARNYCIYRAKKNYKIQKNKISTPVGEIIPKQDSALSCDADEDGAEIVDLSTEAFVEQFLSYWTDNVETIFTKRQDRWIVGAILTLFERKDSIQIFNKKAVYLYIKEMHNVSTPQITRVLKAFKEKYITMYKEFSECGFIDFDKKY